MEKVYENHEFEAVKLRYQDQVELLRKLTEIDIKIFMGYITLQLVFGGWLSQNRPSTIFLKIGLVIIDLVLAFVAFMLLYYDYNRRKEVVKTIKNCNEALGYTKPNVYLEGKAINPETKFRPWFQWYCLGIAAGVVGVITIIVSW